MISKNELIKRIQIHACVYGIDLSSVNLFKKDKEELSTILKDLKKDNKGKEI